MLSALLELCADTRKEVDTVVWRQDRKKASRMICAWVKEPHRFLHELVGHACFIYWCPLDGPDTSLSSPMWANRPFSANNKASDGFLCRKETGMDCINVEQKEKKDTAARERNRCNEALYRVKHRVVLSEENKQRWSGVKREEETWRSRNVKLQVYLRLLRSADAGDSFHIR